MPGQPPMPNHHDVNIPTLDVRAKHADNEMPLDDSELLLASPILYGFSLSDKIWRALFP